MSNHLVWEKGQLPEKEAVEYIEQIGSALTVCHQGNIIHRDAHPGNMILRADTGTAILIDFGLAGNVETESINQAANKAFAPWEQMLEGRKEPTIDIYTLAASLYYLVTADTPNPSLARKMLNQELVAPKQLNSSLSDRVNEGIIKGLEIESRDRPQSVQEWLELLRMPSVAWSASEMSKPISTPSIPDNVSSPELLSNSFANSSSKLAKRYSVGGVIGLVVVAIAGYVLINRPSLVPFNPLTSDPALISAVTGVNYTSLRDLLAARKWREADEKTTDLMLKAAGRESEGWFTLKSIKEFSCSDLKTIDSLCVKYSNGRFGLSVQNSIYLDTGNKPGEYDEQAWRRFGVRRRRSLRETALDGEREGSGCSTMTLHLTHQQTGDISQREQINSMVGTRWFVFFVTEPQI